MNCFTLSPRPATPPRTHLANDGERTYGDNAENETEFIAGASVGRSVLVSLQTIARTQQAAAATA
jgi:hypothetical protein